MRPFTVRDTDSCNFVRSGTAEQAKAAIETTNACNAPKSPQRS